MTSQHSLRHYNVLFITFIMAKWTPAVILRDYLTMRIDHIVIRVNDLDAASEDYRSLGFNVVPGGEHPGMGSRNALIPFQDGSYLELIAFRSGPANPFKPKHQRAAELKAEGRSPVEQRVLTWESSSEGLVDWAVLPDDIERDIAAARGRGLTVDGPFPGSRLRPDGQTISWQFGVPDGFDLPFLCADVTPRELRAPLEKADHQNGVVGMERIYVAVGEPTRSLERIGVLLGLAHEDNCNEFTLGGTTLRLDWPEEALNLLAPHLSAGGEGLLGVQLKTANPSSRRRRIMKLTHGAALYVR